MTLFPGETILQTKAANAIVSLQDHGLEHLDETAWAMARIGLAGKEAIGGKLHLTDHRLIFIAHALNRVAGQFSILLPAIVELRDASGLISKKLRVGTPTLAYEFVIWGVKPMIAEIERARDAADAARITAAATSDPTRLGSGLERDDLRDFLLRGGSDIFDLVVSPFELANLLSLYELYRLGAEINARASEE